MKFNPDIHHRRSIRLQGYDYSASGVYFVTICVQGRECLLGAIEKGEMDLNEAGSSVQAVWQTLPARFPHLVLDEFVIMPNHVHGILVFDPVGAPLAAPCIGHPMRRRGATSSGDATSSGGEASSEGEASSGGAASGEGAASSGGAASSAPTLGTIMRAFKSLSAVAVNRLLGRTGQPLWQRNYYERVLRNEDELTRARRYIQENPRQWETDKENPTNMP